MQPSHLLPRSLIPSWTTTPIPGLSLTASGLLALADLRTISRRTALVGGASWIDALVLAPGLHYQQAFDNLDREAPIHLVALPVQAFTGVRYAVKNAVTANYLMNLCGQAPGVVTLDVGMVMPWNVAKTLRKMITKRKIEEDDEDDDHEDWHSLPDVDWISHLLYLVSPILTVSSLTFVILFEDWWGLSILLMLILSRILNIWAIKHRTNPPVDIPSHDHRLTEYTIDLGGGHTVRLRGPDADLQALVTHAWLRAQSRIDGYLEAAAKLLVYLSAALGGNMTQAGAMVLVGLLIASAALLGLSNAHARGFRMNGRIVLPETDRRERRSRTASRGSSTAVRDEERGQIQRSRNAA
ncbi:hypothetical protein ACJ41O_008797 [Fusarium nematophilum]